MHGGREDVCIYGRFECACMGGCAHMEGVEWRAWGEGDVYLEGVECACMGRGRVCVYGRGGVCMHGRGEERCVYTKGWSVCARKFDPRSSDPLLSLQNWVWLTRLSLS